jgi:hypothetical protein
VSLTVNAGDAGPDPDNSSCAAAAAQEDNIQHELPALVPAIMHDRHTAESRQLAGSIADLFVAMPEKGRQKPESATSWEVRR